MSGAPPPFPVPPFPGAVGVSHLRVYDSLSPDGLAGGTPHCHTVCTEAYAVVAGAGRVQTLAGDGFRETVLEPGAFVWFTPGTIHRLVNDGDLEILVLMQNAGLPEAGDMVITFPDEVLADPDRYPAAAVLPPDAATTAADDDSARRRRDRGVEGFTELRAGTADGAEGLARFHARAAALVRPQVDRWREVWAAGPLAAVEATDAQLRALADGDASHLARSGVHALPPPPDERRYGCCGTLGTFLPERLAPR